MTSASDVIRRTDRATRVNSIWAWGLLTPASRESVDRWADTTTVEDGRVRAKPGCLLLQSRRGQRDALTAEDSRSRDRGLATPRDDDLGQHRSLRNDHAGSRSPLSCWRASCDGRSRSSALRKDSRAIRYQEAEERPAPRAVRPRILSRPSGSPGRSDCRLGSSPRRASRHLGAS